MATKLSRDDELKLLGLLALATEHDKFLKDIEKAVREIVRDPNDDSGWVNVFVYLPGTVTPKKLWEMTVQQREAATHD